MRIVRIEIRKWRNFEQVAFDILPDAALVCLVGENGTGKSNILELIAGVAERIGLIHSTDAPRGSPFEEAHDLSVTILLPKDTGEFFGADWAAFPALQGGWTGRMTLTFQTGVPPIYDFEGCQPHSAKGFFQEFRKRLLGQREIHYLLLDANRAYPEVVVNEHELGSITSRDWEGLDWKKHRVHHRTSTLYSEWVQYLVATDSQAADRWMEKSRLAAEAKKPQPEWKDHFEEYRTSLGEVLPHLKFSSADRKQRTMIFDSAGSSLRFHQLSGGEREIAFMTGQVSRFGLRRGLFLIDEPELHLNPELVRTWVAWLRNTIKDGQTWLATHSLEAVEVAEAENVFVLERTAENNPTRLVSVSGGANIDVFWRTRNHQLVRVASAR